MARRGKFGKAALLLGAAAVAAGVLLKRDKVAGLLPSKSGSGTQDTGWAPSPGPAPSNYDTSGPVANTATPVPAPDALVRDEDGFIDEQAEEAAAAAEAANIGGVVSDYAGIDEPSISADEADRPLVEAGEGSSEGQEQAEAALADAAAPSDGMSDYERQIDDTIEEAAQPFSGETLEPVGGLDEAPTEVYDIPAPPAPDPVAAEPEPVAAEPEPEPAAPEPEPAGEVPFGAGTTTVTPGVPQTEEPAAPEPAAAEPEPEPEPEAQVTPAAPQTGAWQPPAPPEPTPEAAEPESSDPTPPADQPQLPTEEDKDDGNDWRTWSGRAIDR